jgi:hypothetical protein
MQLCRDGTLGRRGSGQIPAPPVVLLGMSDASSFLQLVEGLDERVFAHAGVYDLPEQKGIPVIYTVVFLGGKASQRSVLAGFRFITGSESRASDSLLPYFDGFVSQAVALTEQWYQDGLAQQHDRHAT